MADLLIYWRDYAANWAYQFAEERAFVWHSSVKYIAELHANSEAGGDTTSGGMAVLKMGMRCDAG